jgi:hypothetical protein
MKKLLLFALVLFSGTAFAQLEIPVDMYTGKPSITIPLWTVTARDISEPILLSYDANSATQESRFGMGWKLQAGGSISREVRTYPDDVGYLLDTKGWLYNNSSSQMIGYEINGFTPTADTLSSSYNDEFGSSTKDYEKLNGFNFAKDTEPDIFNYSFGGHSGSFVFDQNGTIRTMPYDDITITYTPVNSSTDKKITSFTIKTNTGYVYTFDKLVNHTKSATESSYFARAYYRGTEFEMYNPGVTYTAQWMLTKVKSPEGPEVNFTYRVETKTNSTPVEVALYKYKDPIVSNATDILIYPVYNLATTTADVLLDSVRSSMGESVQCVYNNSTLTQVIIRDQRRGTNKAQHYVKSFQMGYQGVTEVFDRTSMATGKTFPFLTSVTELSSCEKLPPMKISYNGWLEGLNKPGVYIDPVGMGIDLWGYPNWASKNPHLFPTVYIYPNEPASERYRYTKIPDYPGTEIVLEGSNRNPMGRSAGVINSITSSEGGVTSFWFETNTYLDGRTNTNALAGGLRIKSISYHDGFNNTPITKTFEYLDPVTRKSSGRLIRKPALAMPGVKWKSPGGPQYDSTASNLATKSLAHKWRYLTFRKSTDISGGETTHGSPVGYTVVTVKRPGAGSARHEFYVPARYGDFRSNGLGVSGTALEWTATRTRLVRNGSSTLTPTIDKAGSWYFPYTRNTEFDFERGLPFRKSEYNEGGKLMRVVETQYQYLYKNGSTPASFKALIYDVYPGSETATTNRTFGYGQYTLLTEVTKVPKIETVKTYDTDPNSSSYVTETTEFIYGSSLHKFVTEVKNTNADGIIYSTRLKYPQDYTQVTTGATESRRIKDLVTANRTNMPLETIQTLTRNDTTYVIGGSVVKLDLFSLAFPVVRSRWALKTSPPFLFSTFTNSYVNTASSNAFKIDSLYERVDSVLSCTPFGDVKDRYNPQTRRTSGLAYGYSKSIPLVQIANGRTIEASFSDFETRSDASFSTGTAYYGAGHSGAKALHASVLLQDTLTRGNDVTNYILSFWLKSNTSINFSITFKSKDGVTTYSTSTLTVPPTSSEYSYIQKIVPLTNVPSPTGTEFRIQVQATGLAAPPANSPPANGLSASLLNVIDDVFFYPENSAIVASTVQIPFGVIAASAGSGESSFIEYDKLGRPRFVYDRDKNIVKRNVYQYTNESPLPSAFAIPYPYRPYINDPVTFTAITNECVTDATYQWDWGTGTFANGTTIESHTFTTAGIYDVKMKVTSATYGTRTVSQSITVRPHEYEVNICASGTIGYNNGTPVIEYCDAIATQPLAGSVIFAVTHQITAGETYVYQWKRRLAGSSEWIDVGFNSKEYKLKVFSATQSCDIKCEVRALNAGGSVESPFMSFYGAP